MNRYFPKVRLLIMLLVASLPMVTFASSNAVTLACTHEINVSASTNCALDLQPEQLLEGAYPAGPYELTIQLSNGSLLDMTDVSAHINETYKYSVKNSNSQNYCWGYITIEDKMPPVIECTKCADPLVTDPDCILNCAEYPLFKTIDPETGQQGYDSRLLDKIIETDTRGFINDYVSDNCSNTPNVYYFDRFVTGSCRQDIMLTRTWVAEYELSDGTVGQVECERYYIFEALDVFDEVGEPLIIEGDGTLAEDIIFMPEQNVIISTCSSDISPASIAAYFDNPLTVDYDSDGNGDDPDEGDVDLVVENNEGVWHAYPHYYSYGVRSNSLSAQPITDAVCNINVSYSDLILEACSAECTGNVKVSRTWKIIDWCSGTIFDYKQLIDIVDMVPPVIEVADVEVSVDPWSCDATVQVPAPTKLFDNCAGPVGYTVQVLGKVVEITGDDNEGYVIQKMPRGIYDLVYNATDCCGNITPQTVRLVVDDKTPPVPAVIQNIVVDMSPTGIVGQPDRGVAKVYAADIDNGSYDGCTAVQVAVRRALSCEAEDTLWGDYVRFCCADLAGVPSKEIKVEFRVTDWNGNHNFADATILLEDKGSATTCPLGRVLSCDDDIWDFDLTGYPTAQTSCEYLTLDIDTVRTFENTMPARKSSNVGNVPGYNGVTVEAYDAACGFGAMRRRWYTDAGVFCEQWFVIEPGDNVFDPSTIKFPEDLVVTCTSFDAGEPSWVHASCNLIGVTLTSDTIRQEESACLKVLNNWAVINWCTYDPSDTDLNNVADPTDDGITPGRYDHYQIVQVKDDSYPTVISENNKVYSVDDECLGKGVVLSAVANDIGDCASPWLSWEVRVDFNDDWIIDYTYTYNTTATINGEPNPFYLPKTSNGEAVNITLPDVIAESKAQHRVDWIVNDGCGNVTLYDVYFTVEDTKAPVPYCLNLGTSVMSNGQVELWAIDFNRGGFDNCTATDDLLYTFTDVPPPPRCDEEYDGSRDLQWYDGSYWFYDSSEATDDDDRDCPIEGRGAYDDGGYNPDTRSFDDYNGDIHKWQPELRSSGKVFTRDDVGPSQFIQIPIYVWDGCLNVDFCYVSLRIVDNDGGAQGIVAGAIKTEDNQLVEDVMTSLSADLPDYPKYVMTDNTGSYAFEDNVLATDYVLSATKNDEHLNGVSTIDLVKIQRHILGIELLGSPYKLLAADINNDEQINGLDLVELRKLILGIYTEFPQNESWKLIDIKSALTLQNPWSYDASIGVNDVTDNMMDQDFVGVKIGDVNNSVKANSSSPRPTSSNSTIEYEDKFVVAGETFDLTFSSSTELIGYQLALELPGLKYIGISGPGLSSENVYQHTSGVNISCNTAATVQGALFTITLQAEKTGLLTDMLALNNSLVPSEAYLANGLGLLNLELEKTISGNVMHAENTPNPFKTETTINFELDEQMALNVSFYDVTGKQLKSMKIEGQKGANSITVTAEELGTGIVYYKLQGVNINAINSMIILP